MNTSNNNDERITFDEAEDPFMALLQHLDPFIDELLTPPEFHRFLHLPLGLRYPVYEQHFLHNTKSTFTAH
jgi:hypothetical protein